MEKIIHDGSFDKAVLSLNRYMEWKKNWMLGIESPYPYIDKITSWIIRGKVYTIAWYSNTGKSKFSYNYVNHFLKMDKKVIFYSLEVDSWMVLWNLACNRYEKNFSDLELEDIIEKDFNLLQIYDTCYNIQDIIEITEKERPDIIFIDFVQNVQCSWSSEYERMSIVARDMQQMAIVYDVTVFSLSQLSNSAGRDVTRWESDFIPLKWAGELYASSDVIFLLHPDWWDAIQLSIIKNKYGPKESNIPFITNFSKWTFVINKNQILRSEDPF
jgi:replicative DNA helicase